MLIQSQIAYSWSPRCSGPYVSYTLYGGGKAVMKAAATVALQALDTCLRTYNYKTIYSQTGAQNCRQKVGGGGWSIHAYGAALDINWILNPYGGTRHHIPTALGTAICRVKTNNGKQVWNWGGFWSGTRDWMHFELVCTPRDLATGINWSTVAGAVPAKPLDLAALRKWVAGDLFNKIQTLPVMWLNNIRSPQDVVTLRQALNLVLNENLPVDGVYDADQDWQVQRFQKNVNKLYPGAITENLGTFGPQTKMYLASGLVNIRDDKA